MKVIAVVLCLLISLAQGQAQAEWTKVFPVADRTLQSATFPDSVTIIVVVATDHVARSSDNGSTWVRTYIESRSRWHRVESLADGIVLCFGDSGAVARSKDKGLTWSLSRTLAEDLPINTWSDGDKTIIVSGASGSITRSIDAGETWEPPLINSGNPTPFITKTQTGRLLSFDTVGTISYSDDAGFSWRTSSRDSYWRIFGLHMMTNDSGVAIGSFKGIALTSDGGVSWQSDTSVEYEPWILRPQVAEFATALFHQEPSGTLVAVFPDGKVYTTTRSLLTWTRSALYASPYDIEFNDFVSDRNGRFWAVHRWEGLLQLSFPGPTSTYLRVPHSPRLAEKGVLTSQGLCAHYGAFQVHLSLDTGRTWSSSSLNIENKNAPSYWPVINVLSNNRIVLSGNCMYRYTSFETDAWYEAYESVDSGRSWTVYDLPSVEDEWYEFDIANGGHACMYGDFGFKISIDDFKSYVDVNIGSAWTGRKRVEHCLATDKGLFFCYGTGGGIVRTADSGRSLQRATVPTTNDLSDMMFADHDFGVCVGKNGTVLKSNDGGVSWSAVQSGIPADVTCVYVSDATTWMIGATMGWVKVTTDGGATWRDISLPEHTSLNDVTNVVILGPNDYMISTLQGAYRGHDLGGSTYVPDSTSFRHSVTTSLLSISPNPATNSASIVVGDRSPILQLFDAAGRLVASYTVDNGRVTMNTSGFATGVYYAVSDTASGVLMVKR